MSEAGRDRRQKPEDDIIDLREICRALWAGRWLTGFITLAATVASLIVALMLPNTYRAEALVAPNDQGSARGLSSMAAQYGNLASLAGISIDTGFTDKAVLGLEILKSRKFISEFIERHDLLVPLMAVRGWNADTGELILDPKDYDASSNKWIRKVRPPRKTIPSFQEAYKEFMDIFSAREDKQSGLVTIAIEHYSPTESKKWVDWLVEDLNSSIMRQDVAEAEQAIEYLNEQIANTSVAELRNVFFNLVEEQTKVVMLANVSDEYLFKMLDPAVAPEEKSKPRRIMIVIVSSVVGLFFSVFLILFRGPTTSVK